MNPVIIMECAVYADTNTSNSDSDTGIKSTYISSLVTFVSTLGDDDLGIFLCVGNNSTVSVTII